MAKGLANVLAAVDQFELRVRRGAQVAATQTEIELQSHAKRTRPWRDRTNVARNSITGSSEVRGTRIVVALAIGASYGKYLELSRFSRYAVIEPTIRAKRDSLALNLKKAVRL